MGNNVSLGPYVRIYTGTPRYPGPGFETAAWPEKCSPNRVVIEKWQLDSAGRPSLLPPGVTIATAGIGSRAQSSTKMYRPDSYVGPATGESRPAAGRGATAERWLLCKSPDESRGAIGIGVDTADIREL